jgi:putative N6-adenine-specific DNA methylase
MDNIDQYFVITTYAGLEEVLAKELLQLGAKSIEIHTRAVSCQGDLGFMYKANFSLRCALRVLNRVKEFTFNDGNDLYEHVKEIDWEQYMNVSQTFAVHCTLSSDKFDNNLFPALKAKDAIADYFRAKNGSRPDVDKDDPDLDVQLFIHDDTCRLFINSSGESLHKRGYRSDADKAPLSEVLAAGLVILSEWIPLQPMVDFMCGSGTILTEAALYAAKIPPGVFRKRFSFEKWINFNSELYTTIKESQIARISDTDIRIYGSDLNRYVVAKAKNNIEAAGVEDMVTIQTADFRQFERPQNNGTIIINPPYGEKLEVDDITKLYEEIGDHLKKNYAGYKAWIFTGSPEGARSIGLRASKKIKLFNGPIECRFLKFDLFEGSKKLKKQKPLEED